MNRHKVRLNRFHSLIIGSESFSCVTPDTKYINFMRRHKNIKCIIIVLRLLNWFAGNLQDCREIFDQHFLADIQIPTNSICVHFQSKQQTYKWDARPKHSAHINLQWGAWCNKGVTDTRMKFKSFQSARRVASRRPVHRQGLTIL